MNINDFIITIIISLLAGVGLGLTIKEIGSFLLKIIEKFNREPKVVQTVDFSYFFGNHNEESK
ncbi:hypothetical protein [Candidatus Methylobacter oryzae]|uniref:Uncharacterized protein n=1 Tax=Candidatus Methylobacter oryzae TaxID=2497749 RepID=A0ABY3CHI1_9GAMM|nr:hypothetical protein [Candidatus Methylobacter oryzae]TRX03595.1 hypothetical protein EKO24_000415 [Candidatus Methylobacter oryzae]